MSDFEKSHDAEQWVLSNLIGGSASLALYSTLPDENGAGGVEITGGGYARQTVNFSSPTVASTTESSIQNTNTVTFGPAGSTWNIAGAVLYVNTGFYYAPLTITVTSGQSLTFNPGDIICLEG